MLPINEAPKDGTPVILYNKKWDVFPLARWKVSDVVVPTEQDVDVNLTGWFFDELICLGEEEGFLGWESDYENGDMPTHFFNPDPEFYNYQIKEFKEELQRQYKLVEEMKEEIKNLSNTLADPHLRFKDIPWT